MSIFKDFLKSSGLYFFGNILSKLIMFFLLPIYTTYIIPEDLGYYDISQTYLNLIVTFLFVDIYVGIMRFLFDDKEKPARKKTVFNGGIIFTNSLLIYSVVAFCLWIFFDVSYIGYIYLYGVSLVFNNLFGYIARALGHNRLFAFSGVVNTLVVACLNLIGFLCFKGGIQVLFISAIAGMVIQVLLLERKLKLLRQLSLSDYDKELLKKLFQYSIPLSVNSLAYWFLTGYSNAAIANLLGLEANGIYMVAVKFGMVLNMLSTCFQLAWQELAFKKGDGNKKELSLFYSKAFNLLLSFLGIGVVAIIHFSFLVFPYMVSGSYAASLYIIPAAIIATTLNILSGFIGQIYAAVKATKVIMYSTLTACAVNIFLVPLFIRFWDLQGAVIAMSISYGVNILMRLFIIRNVIYIKPDYRLLARCCLLLILSLVLFYSGNIFYNTGMLIATFILAFITFRKYIIELIQIFRK